MTDAALMRRARVHKGTLYPMLKGQGGGADDATLKRLADALGVPAPRIERRLTWDPAPEPETPLAMVRAAQALLDRLVECLERER